MLSRLSGGVSWDSVEKHVSLCALLLFPEGFIVVHDAEACGPVKYLEFGIFLPNSDPPVKYPEIGILLGNSVTQMNHP